MIGALQAEAWESTLSGFADAYHAQRLQHPQDVMSSRARLRLQNWITHDRFAAFGSLNAEFNNVIYDETQIRIHELYADYAADRWDVRVGRQLIIWGKADGLTITDLLCTRDYTEFLARDFDDTRLPVDALKTRWLQDNSTWELVFIPQFKPAELAPAGSPWAVYSFHCPAGMSCSKEADDKPACSLDDAVYAARYSSYTPLFDLSLCAMYTWDELPLMTRHIEGSAIRFSPEFRRKTVAGVDISIPCGDVVFRAETAYIFKRWFTDSNPVSSELYDSPLINAMAGIDWNPGNDWSITAQLNDGWIIDYHAAMPEDRHTALATLNISKKLINQTLELSSMGYYGLTRDNGFVRFKADYALTDACHLIGGCDLFYGDPDTLFGRYDDNSEVFGKIKYSF